VYGADNSLRQFRLSGRSAILLAKDIIHSTDAPKRLRNRHALSHLDHIHGSRHHHVQDRSAPPRTTSIGARLSANDIPSSVVFRRTLHALCLPYGTLQDTNASTRADRRVDMREAANARGRDAERCCDLRTSSTFHLVPERSRVNVERVAGYLCGGVGDTVGMSDQKLTSGEAVTYGFRFQKRCFLIAAVR
jgi:hypothetical protein